jgi:hypothetical protein
MNGGCKISSFSISTDWIRDANRSTASEHKIIILVKA